jgi:hypothetical protein
MELRQGQHQRAQSAIRVRRRRTERWSRAHVAADPDVDPVVESGRVGSPAFVTTGPGVDEDRDPTNVSYVDWGEVANALHLQVSIEERNDPRFR